MSVLREARFRGQPGSRRALSIWILWVLLGVAFPGPDARGQETVLDEEVSAVEAARLWAEVVERYEVVVLSRGLLLEPLDRSVELRTIEIGPDGIAVDGELVGEQQLRERTGAEEADLLLRLGGLEPAELRRIFEAGAQEEPALAPVEARAGATTEAAESELAPEAEERELKYKDSRIVVGNSLTVEVDEVVEEAVVFGGPLYVHGKVAGDAAAIGGHVTVSGEVTGDVVAVGGDLTIEPGAEVLGDAVSVGGEVEIDDTARVRGQVIEVPFGPSLRFSAWPRALFKGPHEWWRGHEDFDMSPGRVASRVLWEAFKLVVLALLACLVMLVARHPLERVRQRAGAEPWKSGLVGLLTQILFVPLLVLVTLILVVSIIGIPLLLLVPFFVLAIILLAFLGYCGVAMGIGRFLQERFGWQVTSPYLVLVLGVVAIQVWSAIGELLDFGWGPLWFFAVMFAVFGVLAKYVAWTVGLGAAVLTRFGTAEAWGGGAGSSPPAAPPPEPGDSERSAPPASSAALPEENLGEPPRGAPGDSPEPGEPFSQ